MWQNHECTSAALNQFVSKGNWYTKQGDIWIHSKQGECSCLPKLARNWGLASLVRCKSATEQLAAEKLYVMLRRRDWAKNGIAAKLREMLLMRREKHYAEVHAMAGAVLASATKWAAVSGWHVLLPSKIFPWASKRVRLGLCKFAPSRHPAKYFLVQIAPSWIE